MDINDIKKTLEEAGIPVGKGWSQTTPKAGIRSPLVDRQRRALKQIEDMLVKQVQEDQQQVADLHIALQQLKSGGGISRG